MCIQPMAFKEFDIRRQTGDTLKVVKCFHESFSLNGRHQARQGKGVQTHRLNKVGWVSGLYYGNGASMVHPPPKKKRHLSLEESALEAQQ